MASRSDHTLTFKLVYLVLINIKLIKGVFINVHKASFNAWGGGKENKIYLIRDQKPNNEYLFFDRYSRDGAIKEYYSASPNSNGNLGFITNSSSYGRSNYIRYGFINPSIMNKILLSGLYVETEGNSTALNIAINISNMNTSDISYIRDKSMHNLFLTSKNLKIPKDYLGFCKETAQYSSLQYLFIRIYIPSSSSHITTGYDNQQFDSIDVSSDIGNYLIIKNIYFIA